MKGYLARITGCCGTTSVDFGSYSSIDMVWARTRHDEKSAAKKNFIGLTNILQRMLDVRYGLEEALRAAVFLVLNQHPTSKIQHPFFPSGASRGGAAAASPRKTARCASF